MKQPAYRKPSTNKKTAPPAYGNLAPETVEVELIPLTRMVIDCETELLSIVPVENGRYDFVRKAHAPGYKGYQRDPSKRALWLKKHIIDRFDPEMLHHLNVAERADGFFATVDGGGRTFAAMKLGITALPCRVHRGLTPQRQAELFRSFANEVVRLKSVDDFHAAVAAGNETAIAITEALAPHYAVGSGKTAISSVGSVNCIYTVGSDRLLSKTAMLCRNIWGPDPKAKPRRSGYVVPGNVLVAVAGFIDASRRAGGFDEGAFRKVMSKSNPLGLIKEAQGQTVTKAKTQQIPYLICTLLNKQYRPKEGPRLTQKDIYSSHLLEAFAKKQYGGYQSEKLK